MNPTTVDPDLKPLYDYRDTYDPAAPISERINPQPDLKNPAVLIRLLKESERGMLMEAEANSGIGNQCGCSNPSHFFTVVSKQLGAAAKMLEDAQPKPTPAEAPPAEPPLTKPDLGPKKK